MKLFKNNTFIICIIIIALIALLAVLWFDYTTKVNLPPPTEDATYGIIIEEEPPSKLDEMRGEVNTDE